MAAILFSLALMFGAAIGTRYRVAALVLVLPLVLGIVCWLALRLEAGIATTLVWGIVSLTGVQFGYLAGGFLALKQRPYSPG
ncbi:hypothetical protein [Bradyrhizobium sp. 62]|uniref:hypothetical protein n=1 Tax=Bradyrhizobium sp. 62 TaxID=1043588 RepID=UPI001FFA4FC2|nr:hypothetical protein [Bradyrhizobium sp. 62]MCK1368273.1 hypothetical protein [Bradyrhizobium sp. 62]